MRKVFRKITIRTNILTNIIIVVALVAVALLLLQYYFSRKMALMATEKTFKQIAEKITIHMKDNDRFFRILLAQIELYPSISVEPSDGNLPGNARRFARTMAKLRTIYAIYVGYANGDLFEVINLQSDPHLLKRFRAPEQSRWLITKVFDTPRGRVRRYAFYDEGLRFLGKREEKFRYDVRRRPWYLLARKHAGEAVRSAPYLFSNLGRKGITYSKMLGRSGAVAAIDFTLRRFDTFLQKQVFAPTAGVWLFDPARRLIATSERGKTLSASLLEIFKNVSPGRV